MCIRDRFGGTATWAEVPSALLLSVLDEEDPEFPPCFWGSFLVCRLSRTGVFA